jgi:hypothetical protein
MSIKLHSADCFWPAAALSGIREARVLEGFGAERAAKFLIPCELVRCPASLIRRGVGQV